MTDSLTYAIDFGTSNSLLAAARGQDNLGTVTLDPNAPDNSVLRSIFYTSEPGHWAFGEDAIRHYTDEGGQGRMFRSIKKYLPEPAFTGTQVHGRNVSLPELIAVFLKHVKAQADSHFGRDVTQVVLGRPARFAMDDERDKVAEDRLRKAAQIAGFKHIDFCPEPVAAAYDFRSKLSERRTVLIADFGGGTSDFTVVRLGPQAFKASDVLSLGGVSLAGDHFESSIMRHELAQHFGSQVTYRVPMGSNDMTLPKQLISKICHPADIVFLGRKNVKQYLDDVERYATRDDDRRLMRQLKTLVEESLGYKLFSVIESTKRELSQKDESLISFHESDIAIDQTVSRHKFESDSDDVVSKILGSLDETIKQSGLTFKQIDIVCCTGGTAKIPALARGLADRFGADKLSQHNHFHSVILGLAERAKELNMS